MQEPGTALIRVFELRRERPILGQTLKFSGDRSVEQTEVRLQTAGPDFRSRRERMVPPSRRASIFSVMTGAHLPARRTRKTMPFLFKSPATVRNRLKSGLGFERLNQTALAAVRPWPSRS